MRHAMTVTITARARRAGIRRLGGAFLSSGILVACGGGGALDNAPTLANATQVNGQTLSFAYFQYCVHPVLTTAQSVAGGGSTNTCSSSGCHDNTNGTGGALRLRGSAAEATLPATDPTTPGRTAAVDAARASEIYKNYYSSLGETVVGSPDQSRLLNKPLVRGVLHGGGVIFATPDDAAAKTIRYWISRPMPQGQDEFGSAADSMFTGTPGIGTCNAG
jgi:hypothetical protein